MHGHSTTESVSFRHLAPANVLREMQPGQGVLVYGHLAPTRIALRPWFKDRRLRRLARTAKLACRGGATVSAILEDLTTLSPKRLEKRLEALARDALPCRSVTVFDGNPERGAHRRAPRRLAPTRRRARPRACRRGRRSRQRLVRLVASRSEPPSSPLAPPPPGELSDLWCGFAVQPSRERARRSHAAIQASRHKTSASCVLLPLAAREIPSSSPLPDP